MKKYRCWAFPEKESDREWKDVFNHLKAQTSIKGLWEARDLETAAATAVCWGGKNVVYAMEVDE